jgi:hypothetical protein
LPEAKISNARFEICSCVTSRFVVRGIAVFRETVDAGVDFDVLRYVDE